jgi:predicted N-acetyltransferase YhbS
VAGSLVIRSETSGDVGAVATIVADGHPLIVLEGSPAFEARFGFEDSRPAGSASTYLSGLRPRAGHVPRLAAYDRAIGGDVVYPPAFDGVS